MFALAAVYYEIEGCLELVKFHPKLRDHLDADGNEKAGATIRRAIKLRMTQMLSGQSTSLMLHIAVIHVLKNSGMKI